MFESAEFIDLLLTSSPYDIGVANKKVLMGNNQPINTNILAPLIAKRVY